MVGDNTPRFDHDLTTRESKGLLIEESRTNFMKYSDEFAIASGNTGGNWDSIGGASDYTRVSDTTETKDPTGITNHASKITFVSGNATLRGYWYSGAANGAVTKTYSVYLKRATSNTTTVIIDIGDQGATSCTLTDEWKRYSVTTSSAGNGNFVDMTLTTGASTPYYAWGCQIEAGGFATSYIPTSTAAVARGADTAFIDGQHFTDLYNVPEGTFVLKQSVDDTSTSNQWAWGVEKSTNRGGFFNGLGFRVGGGGAGYVGAWYNNNGSTSAFLNMNAGATVNIPFVSAFAYKVNDMAATTSGITVLTDTSASIATAGEFDRFSLGSYHYDSMSTGHIQRVMYYRKRLPNSQLVTLTS